MPPPSTTPARPGRLLLTLLAILLAFGGIMFWTKAYQPRLALDLAGGTTVTLSPVTQAGKKPPQNSLDRAVEIIRTRVNALGVAEADVTKSGDNIIVAVPGKGQKEVIDLIGQTAELRFRHVLAIAPATMPEVTTSPSPTPTGKKGEPKATPAASPTARQRAMSAVLTGRAPPTPSPENPPQLQVTPPPAQQDPTGTVDLSGLDPELQRQFATLSCAQLEEQRRNQVEDPDKQLVTCDSEGAFKYALDKAEVLGTMLKSAEAGINPDSGEWMVTLSLKGEGPKKWGALTQRVQPMPSPRNQVAIVLDGKVVSAPQIIEPILGGQAQITGDFTQREARELANVLKYGALPLTFKRSSAETVSATLGRDQLNGGVLAGIIGLGLVVLFSLLYYRGLGLVSVFSLVVAALLTYQAVVLLGHFIDFRLSLAAIAGLIVAIGITADSFVVYFERLRDEVRDGRTLRAAVERGWRRARRTILVADAVGFLAAVVLYLLAVGGVKGFAFTLGLVTLLDVVVVFLFTKPLVTLLARTRFFGQGHPLSGLDPGRLGGRLPGLRATPREA